MQTISGLINLIISAGIFCHNVTHFFHQKRPQILDEQIMNNGHVHYRRAHEMFRIGVLPSINFQLIGITVISKSNVPKQVQGYRK